MAAAAFKHTLSKLRQCPQCDTPMRPYRYKGVVIDRCGKCSGTFFEPGESSQAFGAGAEAADWARTSDVAALGPSDKQCPCRRHRMEGYRLAFGEERLEVDVCLNCRGIWLDEREKRHLNIIVAANRAAATGAVALDRRIMWLHALIGVPVEELNPVWRQAYWVSILLALLGAIYLAEIVLLNSEVLEAFVANFALIPTRIVNGAALWTLVTSIFVHAGYVGFLGNLIFLKIFGDNVEDKLGATRFLAIFLLAGLAGALAHVLVHPRSASPVLGADSAVAGVIGAYIVLFPRVRIWSLFSLRLPALIYALMWVAVQLVAASIDWLELVQTGVPWFGHLAGFAVGVLLTTRFRARILRRLSRERSSQCRK